MQEQLEELEYIKNNMKSSSNSSIPSNEIDENLPDMLMNSSVPMATPIDDSRRKRFNFLQEAKRLAQERRDSQLSQWRRSISNEPSHSSEENESFNFDQRSEEDHDTAYLPEVIPGNRSIVNLIE